MITQDQLPEPFRKVVDEQVAIYGEKRSIQVVNKIPDTTAIPIQNDKQHWLKIPGVICVFVDMKGSTLLSAKSQDRKAAGAYQLFTGTAVRLFNAFEAPYIDVKGDGAFALFDKDQPFRALVAAVTFKTFAREVFVKKMGNDPELGSHLGIDQKTVLVRRIGLKRYGGRTDRQNEVWAGRPINMAAKLASMSDDGELLVSDRFFKNIQHELAVKSCGCPHGEKVDLWTEIDLTTEKRFDFDTAYRLGSNWCGTHGREYCENILKLDGG